MPALTPELHAKIEASGKRTFHLLLLLIAAGFCFGLTVLSQIRADIYRPDRSQNELLYLPNEKLLHHLTGGMSTIIADVLWLQCIQYTAAEAKGARNFTWLNHMVNTVVRLDPYFVDAYRYGAIFLSGLKADSDAGLDLLKRGMVQNPCAWELPYEAAMVYLLNRRDLPDARRQAAFYLAMASATGKAPQLVTDVAAKLGAEQDLGQVERDMWIALLQSDDQLLRDMAGRKLELLNVRDALKVVNERIRIFQEHMKRPPARVEELVDVGLLNGLPPDPFGGSYFIGPDGQALSTTLLDEEKNEHLIILREAISRYQKDQGAYPRSLEELLNSAYITQIPPHPYPGRSWFYNWATGVVE